MYCRVTKHPCFLGTVPVFGALSPAETVPDFKCAVNTQQSEIIFHMSGKTVEQTVHLNHWFGQQKGIADYIQYINLCSGSTSLFFYY